MKLLILTCLVALAIARPMVEKISESEEYVAEIPEKHLKRRDNIPFQNEHRAEINRYLRPEYEMMNLYYQPFYWSEEMRNLKMSSLPKDRRMAVLKSTVSDEVLPPFQHKYLSLPKSKGLPFSHRQILPFHTLRMVPLSHKPLTIPKREKLPISERVPAHERESLSAHERESLLAHEREILLPAQREMVPEREILLASERVVLPEQEREILPDNERFIAVHKREILPVPDKEKNLPLFQQRVLSLPQRDIVPHYQRDTIAQREVLPVDRRELIPEVVALDLYPFLQPMANYYYPTELNKLPFQPSYAKLYSSTLWSSETDLLAIPYAEYFLSYFQAFALTILHARNGLSLHLLHKGLLLSFNTQLKCQLIQETIPDLPTC
ncbi:beta-casein [Petaurus breviceps papuanus]|uniref:beta-casein n=1 Tax=Petaurus breviceps papuanus TaxID=3040969 RepID=UPI0036D9D89C